MQGLLVVRGAGVLGVDLRLIEPDISCVERADHEGMGYGQWRIDRAYLIAPAGAVVAQWLQSFRDYPPRQKPGSFNLNHVMEAMSKPANN